MREIAGSAMLVTVEKIDRKSTRLNSSHSQISYAVFCLKKKKNKQQIVACVYNHVNGCSDSSLCVEGDGRGRCVDDTSPLECVDACCAACHARRGCVTTS